MKTMALVLMCLLLLGCASQQPIQKQHIQKQQAQEVAFVSVAENARSGGMTITAIDGKPLASDRKPLASDKKPLASDKKPFGDENGIRLPIGKRTISAACRLNNGIRASFNFEVDLLANHSYCFFSLDEGASCKILYTQIGWQGEEPATCQ